MLEMIFQIKNLLSMLQESFVCVHNEGSNSDVTKLEDFFEVHLVVGGLSKRYKACIIPIGNW